MRKFPLALSKVYLEVPRVGIEPGAIKMRWGHARTRAVTPQSSGGLKSPWSGHSIANGVPTRSDAWPERLTNWVAAAAIYSKYVVSANETPSDKTTQLTSTKHN